MSKSFKIRFYSILISILLTIFFIIIFYLYQQGIFGVYMKLNGNDYIKVEIHEEYIDEGLKVKNKFKEIKDIQIESNYDKSKIGLYEIKYLYKDKVKTRTIEVVDTISPILKLKGKNRILHFQNEEYIDPGIDIYDNSKEDLFKNLKITESIQINKIGEYKVIYEVVDSSNNYAFIERIVEVIENPMNLDLHYHYDHLDNTRNSWWFKKANDHERKPPTFDLNVMKEYQAYYLGNDEKKIYLTFDEGGNDKTYIKEITDILNKHEIKASYFLTRNYIYNESLFMNELVENGHEIGNHTRNHLDMTSIANEIDSKKFVEEIMVTHKTIYQVTNQIPPLIFRFPKGDFSIRSLAMVHDLGFKTYFWSHAYNDYGEDVLKEVAYNNLVMHLHHGAIYLLHPANKGNFEAMEDFIIEAKKQGYTFGLVSEIK